MVRFKLTFTWHGRKHAVLIDAETTAEAYEKAHKMAQWVYVEDIQEMEYKPDLRNNVIYFDFLNKRKINVA